MAMLQITKENYQELVEQSAQPVLLGAVVYLLPPDCGCGRQAARGLRGARGGRPGQH